MRPEERGLAMSLWAMGALFGPILGTHCSPPNVERLLTTVHRSRLRRFPLSSRRLALDLLGPSHRHRSSIHRRSLHDKRNLRARAPRTKDQTPA
jgi:hypothetical protein